MLGKALLLACVVFLGNCSNKFFGDAMVNRPLVMGALAGLVMGDARTGLVTAAVLELAWLGVMYLGLNMGNDVTAGAVLGTAFAVLTGTGPGMALLLSIPFGVLSAALASRCELWMGRVMPRADACAARGDFDGVARIHILLGLGKSLVMALFSFALFLLLRWPVQAGAALLPACVLQGLDVFAGVFPAMGFAMLLNTLWDKRFVPFFFLGFVLCAFFGAGVPAVTALAVCGGAALFLAAGVRVQIPAREGMHRLVTRADLRRVFFRSFCHEASYNAEREQALGFAFTLGPLLKKLYRDAPAEKTAACMRHVEYFNLTVQITNFVVGITTAFEEQNAAGDAASGDMVSGVKNALMGPLAAIGDTYFWGGFRILAAAAGAALCLQGSWTGVVLFLVLFNVPQVLVRWGTLQLGYRLGGNFMDFLANTELFHKLTDAAVLFGLTVTGALTAAYVRVDLGAAGVQSALTTAFPQLLPLVLMLLLSWLMRKKDAKPTVLIPVLGVCAIVLGTVGALV